MPSCIELEGVYYRTAQAWICVPCIENSTTMKVCLCSVWIFSIEQMTWDDHNTAFEHKEESLEVRAGIFLLLNCSIHGMLPLCMNG